MGIKKVKLTKTSVLHFIKLIGRALILAAAAFVYVYNLIAESSTIPTVDLKLVNLFTVTVWVIFTVEMLLRFFPSKLESPGCQKQFRRNFIPTGKKSPMLIPWRRTLAIVLAWVALNAVFGVLYIFGIIDIALLTLISLAYSVCDMICILFFCPFHAWFMRNRCCADCRIYNWDFAMMFTPLIFIPHWFTWTLLGLSLLLLIRWEITYKVHPERFSEATNAAISCENCTEKLCKHKKHIISYMKAQKVARNEPYTEA